MKRMRYEIATVALCAATTLGGAACTDTAGGPTAEILATGFVLGTIYQDQNGNGLQDGTDPGLPGLEVRLAYRGTTTPILIDTTDSPNGGFRFDAVPVGAYWVTVDSLVLGDSLDVVQSDTSAVDVLPGQGTTQSIGLAFFQRTIAEARALPPGTKVSVEGFALNDRTLFGDSTVHVTDGTTSIRATTVFRAGIRQGDSVRVVGRTAVVNGQPVIDRVTARSLAFTGVPLAPFLTTQQATQARGAGQPTGALDAGHARVTFATVIDTATVGGGDFRVRVNDGSGLLEVILDNDVPFNRSVFRVDSVMTQIRGLLLPTGAGTWDLRPRGMGDIIP